MNKEELAKAVVTKTCSVQFDLICGEQAESGATPWYTKCRIGDPIQSFRFMIDTGTDNTWVTSHICKSQACNVNNRGRFHHDRSKTYKSINHTEQSRNFGPWGEMLVYIGSDHFMFKYNIPKGHRITKKSEKKLHFQLAVQYTGCHFKELRCDGGVAVPSPYWNYKGDELQSLVLEFYKHDEIQYKIVSFGFTKDHTIGECLFGAVNPNWYIPETLQWIPLIDLSSATHGSYAWAIAIKKIEIGSIEIDIPIDFFILDTGSSWFKGTEKIINKIVELVTDNGKRKNFITDSSELENYPDINLTIGERTYEMTPSIYFLKISDQYWELGFHVLHGLPPKYETLIAGTLLLETVYTIFDLDNKQIGIAVAK